MSDDRAGSAGPTGPALRDVQALLYELITAPAGVGPGLAARGLAPAALEAVIVGDARLSATARLDIYANMYFFRILDVLRGELPRVRAAVGDDAFHDLITDYLLAVRPAHPSLREVGARLPAYLAQHPLGLERPWLAPLARLERTHRELFDGPDATPLTAEIVRALGPDGFVQLEVGLVPAHAILEHASGIAAAWEPLASGQAVTPATASETLPEILPETVQETLIVWRQGLAVRHRVVADAAERAMLAGLAKGRAALGSLCEIFVAAATAGAGREGAVTELAAGAFQVLARWIDDGLLVAAPDAPAR